MAHDSNSTGPGQARGRETALEWTYAARLRAWLGVTADVQWILNPGGAGRRALVASVRAELGL